MSEHLVSSIQRHLGDLHARSTGLGGHDGNGNSWAVAEIPDWELRQIQDALTSLAASNAGLLDALRGAKEFIENLQLPDSEWSRILDLCVAAIAKAEGR